MAKRSEVPEVEKCDRCGESLYKCLDVNACARRALARERDDARTTRAAVWAALSRAGISHGESVEGLAQGLGVVADLRDHVATGNGLYAAVVHATERFFPTNTRDLEWDVLPRAMLSLGERAEKAEARAAELERELDGMRQRARAAEAQRDEAVSRSHESLTESVRAKADAARLREACARVVGRGMRTRRGKLTADCWSHFAPSPRPRAPSSKAPTTRGSAPRPSAAGTAATRTPWGAR